MEDKEELESRIRVKRRGAHDLNLSDNRSQGTVDIQCRTQVRLHPDHEQAVQKVMVNSSTPK